MHFLLGLNSSEKSVLNLPSLTLSIEATSDGLKMEISPSITADLFVDVNGYRLILPHRNKSWEFLIRQDGSLQTRLRHILRPYKTSTVLSSGEEPLNKK